MTADDIINALDVYYRERGSRHGRSMATFAELRIGTGYGRSNEQRIDYFAMHLWPTQGLSRIAFEIKVSRSDFLAELKAPLKRRWALLLSNRFYFAAPAGMVRRAEVPVEAGLCEIQPDGKVVWTVDAPERDTMLPPWSFLAAIARRAQESRDQLAEMRRQYETPEAPVLVRQEALL